MPQDLNRNWINDMVRDWGTTQTTPAAPAAPASLPVDNNKGKKKPAGWRSYNIAGAPQWWRGKVPSSFNAKSSYAALANAVIPFLSPEDQRTVAANLGLNFEKQFGKIYDPVANAYPTPPSEVTGDMTRAYSSADRANRLLSALTTMQKRSGAKPGQGMRYLQQVASVMRDFGAKDGNSQTRRQQLQMLSAMDPLMSSSQSGKLAPYNTLSQMLVRPFFSAGSVLPASKSKEGSWVFGRYNQDIGG